MADVDEDPEARRRRRTDARRSRRDPQRAERSTRAGGPLRRDQAAARSEQRTRRVTCASRSPSVAGR